MPTMRAFFEAFIPLFVAIDPIGLVPLFLAVTRGMDVRRRTRVTLEAVFAALAVAVGFMLLGQATFRFLGITENDFRIGGGILLLVLAVLDLLMVGKPAVNEHDIVGIVPLAMPLIAGPALLTAVLVLASRPELGYAVVLMALLVNFALLLATMLAATHIEWLIGGNALRAFSKLVMVLLAAIAVNYIRTGIQNVLAAVQQGVR